MKQGDIVSYDFEVYADDTLIDTSIEELAREHDIFNEEKNYGSRYTVVGTGGPYPGIGEALEKAEVGGEAEVVLEPGKGFKERNPRNVKYFRYPDVAYWAGLQDKKVERGETIVINGQQGIIDLVTSSRVRVDFNPEHAGKTLKVKVKVNRIVKDKDEILRAIIEMNVGSSEGFEFSEEDGVLNIKIPSTVGIKEEWFASKLTVVSQIRRHAGIMNIRYIEEFFKKATAPKEEESSTAEEKGEKGQAEESVENRNDLTGSDAAVMTKEDE